MKRLIRFATSLYPLRWRQRYGREFEALLDDLGPGGWQFIDVLKGAIIMQTKRLVVVRNTKYAVLISLIAAAIITPTGDIPNMMMVAGPMIALFMLGIVIAHVFGKKRQRE